MSKIYASLPPSLPAAGTTQDSPEASPSFAAGPDAKGSWSERFRDRMEGVRNGADDALSTLVTGAGVALGVGASVLDRPHPSRAALQTDVQAAFSHIDSKDYTGGNATPSDCGDVELNTFHSMMPEASAALSADPAVAAAADSAQFKAAYVDGRWMDAALVPGSDGGTVVVVRDDGTPMARGTVANGSTEVEWA